MELELPKDVLGSLPAPDEQGLVRVTAALKITGDGKASLVEINDMPVGAEKSGKGKLLDDDEMPNLDEMERDIYTGG